MSSERVQIVKKTSWVKSWNICPDKIPILLKQLPIGMISEGLADWQGQPAGFQSGRWSQDFWSKVFGKHQKLVMDPIWSIKSSGVKFQAVSFHQLWLNSDTEKMATNSGWIISQICFFVDRGSERGRAIVANLDFFVSLLADLLFLCFADLLVLTNKAANTQSFSDKSDKGGKPFYRQCFV